jgi:hypothetical protein
LVCDDYGSSERNFIGILPSYSRLEAFSPVEAFLPVEAFWFATTTETANEISSAFCLAIRG